MPGRSQITRRQVLAGATAAGVLVAFGGEKALARGLPRAQGRARPPPLRGCPGQD
jgi:hypothetical protein